MAQSILAIIPARKGSKRLENKNILNLAGKPLIAYSIEAAQKSKFINKILVSTNCEKTANLSKGLGAEVPFIRPEELAANNTPTIEVLLHAINFYKDKNVQFDLIVLLQATSPLRNSDDIDDAIRMINDKTHASVSVCETEHSPLWCNTLSEDNSMENFLDKKLKSVRSQDLPKYYRLNGAVYVARIDYLIEYKSFFGKNTKALIMPRERSIDIDTIDDFRYAEYLMNSKK